MTGVSAIGAVMAKDFRTAVSYRVGFILGIFGAFWGLVIVRLLSKLVTGGQFAGDQTGYFKFTVVGLILASILEPAAAAGAGAVRQDQVQGTLEYLATQPVSRLVLGVSWSAYAVVQAMVAGAIVLALTVTLGFRVSHVNVPVVVVTLALTLVVFVGIGNVGSAVVLAFQQGGQLVASFVLLLGVLGGVLFPVAEFPAAIRPITWLSPVTYALAALRSALLPDQPHTSYTLDLLVLAAFAVVVLPLSGVILEMAFRYSQRRGTFSTF